MRNGFGKKWLLILAGILLLVLACSAASLADTTGDIGGTTSAAVSFDVATTGNSSGYIKLGGTRGTANIADYDFYGSFSGYKTEDAFGFFRVEVVKTGYSQTYVWAPSASMSTNGAETSPSLVIVFPVQGTYRVTVTPLAQNEINGVYWAQNRFQSWAKPASWTVSREVNCHCSNPTGGTGIPTAAGRVAVYCYDANNTFLTSYYEEVAASRTVYPKEISGYSPTTGGQYVTLTNGVCNPSALTFRYQKSQGSATLTVYCYDTEGSYIRTYTETVTASRTVYPQEISGYTATSGGQYVTYSNGMCSPASVTFRYQKNQAYGTVTVYCYDTDGNYIRSYTETVTASKMIYPQNINGYNTPNSSQYVTFSNGVCNPSTVTFRYQKIPTSATVTVNCYDVDGGFIRSYTQTISASTTIYPQAITGYKIVSSGQYITYSNGTCSPNTVKFLYEPYAVSATLTVNCYDIAGNFLQSYTETISFSQTVAPREIKGYTATSGGQYVTFSNGVCDPSTVTFRYQKNQAGATLTVECYDAKGNFITSYTETITATTTVYPQTINGYIINSEPQEVKLKKDGTCSPSKIKFNYKKTSVPATLQIQCVDDKGKEIKMMTMTVTKDTKVAPPDLDGYTATSKAKEVLFNDDGTCSPDKLKFKYTKNGSHDTPKYDPNLAYPKSWDTQFKPGTARDGNGNEHQIDSLPNLYDDDPTTVFGWIWWSSESDLTKDTKYPEITAYFEEGTTVSGVGIRNGNQINGKKTYKQYARPKQFLVRIFNTKGKMYNFTMDIPDEYSEDYMEFRFEKTYKNVERIEFWISGYYNGDTSKHVIYLSDMIFYK